MPFPELSSARPDLSRATVGRDVVLSLAGSTDIPLVPRTG